MSIKLGPKGEALAYRIWGLAKAASWERLTLAAIADRLDISTTYARQILDAKGWTNRTRGHDPEYRHGQVQHAVASRLKAHGHSFDESALELTDLIR